jgi:predicted O-methyltransferase YrrM
MLRKFFPIKARSACWQERFPFLAANILNVRKLDYLKKAMGWMNDPVLDEEYFHRFKYLEDLNDRPLRDAEVIGAACGNHDPKILLEIGTSFGKTTALMARNAAKGMVHTVNIPPEEIEAGGKNITFAPSRSDIGKVYRELGLANVTQIFANTATWEPDFGPIDVAFVDGCHDADFVYNDTVKILRYCHPGSIVMWHDFNPELTRVYGWIGDVCQGVEQLYVDGLLTGRILLLQDSWVGLYQVPER